MSSKKRYFISVIAVLLIIGCLGAWHNSISQPQSKRNYKPFDFNTGFSSFNRAYMEAINSGDYWVKDPIAVALHVAGYPNPDNIEPDQVSTFFTDQATVTVIITANKLGDDSVLAKEIRVDLVKRSDIWNVEWAGGRWRCGRVFLIDLGWTTSRCS